MRERNNQRNRNTTRLRRNRNRKSSRNFFERAADKIKDAFFEWVTRYSWSNRHSAIKNEHEELHDDSMVYSTQTKRPKRKRTGRLTKNSSRPAYNHYLEDKDTLENERGRNESGYDSRVYKARSRKRKSSRPSRRQFVW